MPAVGGIGRVPQPGDGPPVAQYSFVLPDNVTGAHTNPDTVIPDNVLQFCPDVLPDEGAATWDFYRTLFIQFYGTLRVRNVPGAQPEAGGQQPVYVNSSIFELNDQQFQLIRDSCLPVLRDAPHNFTTTYKIITLLSKLNYIATRTGEQVVNQQKRALVQLIPIRM